MTTFTQNSLATLTLSLHWQGQNTTYTDRLVARRVNAWRDIFPAPLLESLSGLKQGETATCHLTPGELIPDHSPSQVLHLSPKAFSTRTRDGSKMQPVLGRFYPQGVLQGLPGVFPSTIIPMRVVDMDESTLTVDLNHPLAGRALTIEAHIDSLQEKQSDTGGQLFHWGEELCNNGPGMQERLPDIRTDFFTPKFFERQDTDDRKFYTQPRIISHIDAQASLNLATMYARHLRPGMRVLDLMSSVQSHLPGELDLQVHGLGLNAEEMVQNPILDSYEVYDLNENPTVPLTGQFDAVVVSLSIEYLADPVSVLRSARELLSPGGSILIGTSNRWFPTKAIQGWADLHEFERVGFVFELLEQAGFTGPMEAESMRNDWRPQSDRHFLEMRGVSDPVYVVHAQK